MQVIKIHHQTQANTNKSLARKINKQTKKETNQSTKANQEAKSNQSKQTHKRKTKQIVKPQPQAVELPAMLQTTKISPIIKQQFIKSIIIRQHKSQVNKRSNQNTNNTQAKPAHPNSHHKPQTQAMLKQITTKATTNQDQLTIS